ncbi:OmpP1/FadL family transporter [Pseudomonas sp. NGC7]|uniref:OmpP1/FadL family transporter n=1 Tax=Pseudomonas sp. NGC7 TaxID=3341775 RepID=UPI0037DAB4F2
MRALYSVVPACLLMSVAVNAHATNGNLLTGNGPIASGMGGASVALPQDTTVAANNPAGMAFLGNRMDLYGIVIRTETKATFGSESNKFKSDATVPAPGFGINYEFAPQWSVGLSVYGAGISSDYGKKVAPIPGIGDARASLTVVNTAPTITYKPTENLALGASIIFGVEQFRAGGIAAVMPTGDVVPLENHGNSYATGWGLGLGALWQINSQFSAGASYFTETKFSKLNNYKNDLLTESDGHLNAPSRYAVGVAYKPNPDWKIALDYERILWSEADGFNIPNSFNWRDQDVVRFGVSYQASSRWTVRGGYMYANAHLDSEHTLANFYAPGINSEAFTAGASYLTDNGNSVNFAFEYNIPRTIDGKGASTGTNIHTNFQVYSVGYTLHF